MEIQQENQIYNRYLGYHVNRFDDFVKLKVKKQQKKKSRFDFGRRSQMRQEKTEINNYQTNNQTLNESVDLNSSTDRTAKLLKQNEPGMDIEMTLKTVQNHLPPQWVDIYDLIQDKINHVQDIKKQVKLKNVDRIKNNFNDNSYLDQQINSLMQQATENLKESEIELKKLDTYQESQNETQYDKKIRNNVKQSLAQQIQDITMELRQEQKKMYNQMMKLKGQEVQDSNSNNKYQEFALYEEEQQQKQKINDQDFDLELAKERDSEINKIVEQINELAQIFRQVNDIVIEQGTIMDRIDNNLEKTHTDIKESNKELTKAKKLQEPSMCVKRVVCFLITAIILLCIILVFKYT